MLILPIKLSIVNINNEKKGKLLTKLLDFDILGLQKALRNTDADVTSDLLKSMLDSFREQICISTCQFNRVICILRPKCPQRHFLDLLLNSGYQHSQLPQFCYSVRLKEINENYTKDIYSLTSDINIFLQDFYRIFGQNKTRFHYKRDFKKILTFFEITNIVEINTTKIIIGLNKNLLFVDLEKELVTINPSQWVILDPKRIIGTLNVLSKEYKIKLEISEQSEHNLVITFSFPDAEEDLNENQFDDLIRSSDTLMSYDSETKEIFGELHFLHFQPSAKNFQDFNVSKIRKLFENLDDIRPKEKLTESLIKDSPKKAKSKS